MFGILDYGVGNIRSIANMLDYLNIDNKFVSSALDLKNVDKLILPGIGSFDYAMDKLNQLNFITLIKNFVSLEKNILIGICLGMQLLGKSSEEGKLQGLGLIDFNVLSLKNVCKNNVPNMGWRDILPDQSIKSNVLDESKFYFVHSYYVPISPSKEKYQTIMKTSYEIDYSAGIQNGNIYGFQFHPEKSHKYGMKLFSYLNGLR
jgi:imidazole glycerol-phosphate synthase subunit HisH